MVGLFLNEKKENTNSQKQNKTTTTPTNQYSIQSRGSCIRFSTVVVFFLLRVGSEFFFLPSVFFPLSTTITPSRKDVKCSSGVLCIKFLRSFLLF